MDRYAWRAKVKPGMLEEYVRRQNMADGAELPQE